MALNDQEQKLIDQMLRNAAITNRARDVLRKLYLIAESDVYTVHITNESQVLPASAAGAVSSYADSGTTISVYRGDNQLTGITSGTPTVGQFKVTATATDVTAGAQSVTGTYNITFAVSSDIANGDDTAKISFSINAENVSTFVKVLNYSKSPIGATGPTGATGATGAVGKTVSLSAGAQIISYNAAGDNGTGTITITARSQNFTDPYFRFTGGGSAFTNETSYTNGTLGANADAITFTVPSDYSANAYTFSVSVQEGSSGGEVASDTVTIGSIQPGTDGAAGAAGLAAYPNTGLDLSFSPAANFTLAANSGSWFKDGGGTGLNSHFNSKVSNAFDGECFASFVWTTGVMTFGISSSVADGKTGGASLISIFSSGGTFRGRIVQTGTSVPAFDTNLSSGTRFSFRYDGTETTFFQDGVEIQAARQAGRFIHDETGAVPPNLGGWVLTGSMGTVGSADQVSSVQFLP